MLWGGGYVRVTRKGLGCEGLLVWLVVGYCRGMTGCVMVLGYTCHIHILYHMNALWL